MAEIPSPTIVSGMRPTGRLHLGHYHGVIENWVRLQDDPQFTRRYFFVADWHALTTEYDNTGFIKDTIREIVIDWLAYGVDPSKATIFVQSHCPEHAELHLLLSMITPIPWLTRVPSYKDLQTELSGKDLSTYGFLGYPLLQTADVALYGGTHVPVGADQVAHIELSREVIRRFNGFFGEGLLPEPQPLLTPIPKLLGCDGRKMSKSYNNGLLLSESFEAITKKVLTMVTDPARKRRTDPGNPDICPVFDYHKIYSTVESREWAATGCRTAGIGCIDCKRKLLSHMGEWLSPFMEKRVKIAARPQDVDDIIATGVRAAREVARLNMERVRAAVKLS